MQFMRTAHTGTNRDTSRVYIVYDSGISGFQKLASLAANKRDNPLN